MICEIKYEVKMMIKFSLSTSELDHDFRQGTEEDPNKPDPHLSEFHLDDGPDIPLGRTGQLDREYGLLMTFVGDEKCSHFQDHFSHLSINFVVLSLGYRPVRNTYSS